MLMERGRLLPWVVRLANRERSPMAVSGLRLARPGRPVRLCLTFSLPPAPLGDVANSVTSAGLIRMAEARLRTGDAGELGLLQVNAIGHCEDLPDMVSAAIEAIVPQTMTSEIAPGRFGCIPPGAGTHDLVAVAGQIEEALRRRGVQVEVAAQGIPLSSNRLTRYQAARALRHALSVFARDGLAGLAGTDFTDGLAGYVHRTAERAGLLRRAITERRFDLAYQPIVSLRTGALHHYEALLRPHPIPGCEIASTQEFVLLVETVGLAGELDMAVADTASRAAETAEAAIAFNVSGQSMQNPGFREAILAKFASSRACQAGRLAVEMTETAEIEDVAEAARTAKALRDMGITFCLDDFGAGSSDVRMLRDIDADVVKLDGSYVQGLARDGRERAFVVGLIEIARGAGAEIVAERIETAEEADMLREMGVHYGQGFLFGRAAPLPKPQVTAARRKGKVTEQWG